MESVPLTFEEFDAAGAAFDREAACTPGIDAYCSASDWVVPAHLAFAPGRESWIHRGGEGWLTLALERQPDGRRVLQPLELAWGLASPCVGAEPVRLASGAAALLAARAREWDAAVLTGLAAGGALWRELVQRLAGRHRLLRGPAVLRRRASLAGALDGFLARRGAETRRSLLRAERAARGRGIAIAGASGDAAALYARVLEVEARCWKGLAGGGLLAEPMRGFYARMVPRLLARGTLRLLFARRDGVDVGYILGGVACGVYRGLQFSFDAQRGGPGLGNALQLAQIAALCDEGVALYDLGTDAPYKARWAEETFATSALIVLQ